MGYPSACRRTGRRSRGWRPPSAAARRRRGWGAPAGRRPGRGRGEPGSGSRSRACDGSRCTSAREVAGDSARNPGILARRSRGPARALARLLLQFSDAHDDNQLLLPPVPAADPAARQPGGGRGLRPRVRRADGGGAAGTGADLQPAAAAAPPRRLLPLDSGHPARHAGPPTSPPPTTRAATAPSSRWRSAAGWWEPWRSRSPPCLGPTCTAFLPGGGRLRLRRRARRRLAPDPLVKARDIAAQTGELGILTGRAFLALVSPPYGTRRSWVRADGARSASARSASSITTVFTGMVLALQTSTRSQRSAPRATSARVVALSLVRELGPVLTALMVGGRVGAGIAAELGTMARHRADRRPARARRRARSASWSCRASLADADHAAAADGARRRRRHPRRATSSAVSQLDVEPVTSTSTTSPPDPASSSDVFCGHREVGLLRLLHRASSPATTASAHRRRRRRRPRHHRRPWSLASITILISDFFLTKLFFLLAS